MSSSKKRTWSVRLDLDDEDDMFVVIDDVKIAKRGRPGTLQAGTWISLEPGWTVRNGPSDGVHGSIVVECHGASVH